MGKQSNIAVSVRVPEELVESIDVIAKRNRRGRAAVIRDLIERGLSSLEEGTVPMRIIKALAKFSRSDKRQSRSIALLVEMMYSTSVSQRVLINLFSQGSDKKESKDLQALLTQARTETDDILSKQLAKVVDGKDRLSVEIAAAKLSEEKTDES